MTSRAGAANWPHDRPVRVGVIGTGNMGRNHLRVYDLLKNVELVGIYDPNPDVARSTAARYGCVAFESAGSAIKAVDAVSICSPSTTHGELGELFLGAGVHCLIEKPLAATGLECRRIIDAAAKSKSKLLVGHVERYNPAVRQLSLMLAERGQKIRAIDARRLSAVSQRITDIDVVSDLMVHDLDIVASLANGAARFHSAVAVGAGSERGADHVTALLKLGHDGIACLTASRITQNTVRNISVTTDAGLVQVDYMNQSVEIYLQDRLKTTEGAGAQFGKYALEIAMERLQVRRTEPLQIELSHFIDTIRCDKAPLVSGEDGLAALELVWQIRDRVVEQEREGTFE